MTQQELQEKWTRAQFDQWQQQGWFPTLTYETYLEFRHAQHLETQRQIQELTERYGEPPGEHPPELSAEDERDLRAAWEETAAARAQQKATDQPERIAA